MSDIAISNLAWSDGYNQQVLEMLESCDLKQLEISPFRSSGGQVAISNDAAQALREYTNKFGVQIIALQALLYRHPELTLFDTEETRRQTLTHLMNVCDYANYLGAKILVFGSPKNKIRGTLSYAQALVVAKDFFITLAKYASQRGLVICLEPTPAVYGADFIRDTKEAIDLIEIVDHPAFKLNMDIGSSLANQEDLEHMIIAHALKIGHVHISEPRLKRINLDRSFHEKVATLLNNISYRGIVSIEMLPQPNNNVSIIEETVKFIQTVYGS